MKACNQPVTHIATVTRSGNRVLGSQIAYQAAYSGFDVVAYDIHDDTLTAGKKRIATLVDTAPRASARA